jgi:hypothetical protein
MENYFVEMLSLLNYGEARLDMKNQKAYTMLEAEASFRVVSLQYGWIQN